jgi:hypothetical protein
MDAVKKLAKIDTRLAEARYELRAVDDEQRRALADKKTAEAALADYFAQESVDELHPPDLHNALAEARNRVEQPWAQRREGRQRLVRQIEAERARFVQDNLGALADSRKHDADAARDAVVEALQRIEVVERAYAEVEQYYDNLLRPVPGVNGQDVPTLSLAAVKSEAQRVLERGVPAPLPRSLYAAVEQDPTIRSAA